MRGLHDIVSDNQKALRKYNAEVAKKERGEKHDEELVRLLEPSQTAVKSVA